MSLAPVLADSAAHTVRGTSLCRQSPSHACYGDDGGRGSFSGTRLERHCGGTRPASLSPLCVCVLCRLKLWVNVQAWSHVKLGLNLIQTGPASPLACSEAKVTTRTLDYRKSEKRQPEFQEVPAHSQKSNECPSLLLAPLPHQHWRLKPRPGACWASTLPLSYTLSPF